MEVSQTEASRAELPRPAAASAAERPLKSSGYMPTLDGWRAIAVLAVIYNHEPPHSILGFPTGALRDEGRFGVDLFFAISGLLICSRLLEEDRLTGRIHLKSFYVRRIFRIQPAAWLCLGGIALLMLAHQLPWSSLAWREWAGALFLVRNYQGFSHAADYTGHYWSLAVEEHFYLLLPGILLVAKKHRVMILAALSICFLAWRIAGPLLNPNLLEDAFGRTEVRICGLFIPALFAVLLTRPQIRGWVIRFLHPWVALLCVPLSWVLLRPFGHQITFLVATPILFPLFVISTLVHPHGWLGRVLESSPFRFVGRLSYSLYLWQQLFMFGWLSPASPEFAHLQAFPWRWIFTFGMAIFSFYLVERPLMRLGHRLAPPATPGRQDLQQEPSIANG